MTRISFTGDMAFSKYFKESWDSDNLYDDKLADFLKDSEYCVPNVEGPVYGGNPTAKKELNHCSNPGCVKQLRRIGANIWNFCNNHNGDCGFEGVESTFKVAAEEGAAVIGATDKPGVYPKPYYLKEEGGIAFVSICYNSAANEKARDYLGMILWNEPEIIRKTIEEAKANARWCVVICHGGDEFTELPEPHTREKYLQFLEWGADLVVGHHPHVVQNYEKVGNKMIFYSLGNFVFDTDYQRVQVFTDAGAVLKVTFDEDKYTWESMNTKIDRVNHRILAAEKDSPIWRNINAEEYAKYWPIAATSAHRGMQARMEFLHPEDYKNKDEAFWKNYFDEKVCAGSYTDVLPYYYAFKAEHPDFVPQGELEEYLYARSKE